MAALLHRYDPAVSPLKDEVGRDWAGQTLLDLARECLEATGTRMRRLPRHEIARLALSTSDFPRSWPTSPTRPCGKPTRLTRRRVPDNRSPPRGLGHHGTSLTEQDRRGHPGKPMLV